MKTVIQASVIFFLIIMITLTSISLVTHHALKNELTSAVSNGVEQTTNLLLIHKAYSYDSVDQIIADVLQNIILSKSSNSKLIVNIYNKESIASGVLEIEAIEEYNAFTNGTRQASYRAKVYVLQSEGKTYLKHTDPSSSKTPSERWVFTPEAISDIKAFLKTNEYEFPSQTRNQAFLTRYSSYRAV